MRSAAYHLSISTVRADALFASALQRSDEPSAALVQQAIVAAVRAFGTRGCAARVAQAFGEHPETAVLRMRWAREAVAAACSGAHPALASAPSAQLVHCSGIRHAASARAAQDLAGASLDGWPAGISSHRRIGRYDRKTAELVGAI